MTPDTDPFIRACASKAQYRTKNIAREAINRVRRSDPEAPPLFVYRCPYGRHYHMTHKSAVR